MPYNETQKRATMKYMREHLDEIKIRPHAGTKDYWRTIATEVGESLQEFIIKSVQARIQEIEQSKTRE